MTEVSTKKILFKSVTNKTELLKILELQKQNIPSSISSEEKLKEGFVTVHHDFETLYAMNTSCAHIVATYNGKVIGYALSMLREFKDKIAVLKPMFLEIDTCIESKRSYMVMGQICVDKSFRKQGVFRGLYKFMQSELNHKFDVLITEVDVKNTRSLNAHIAVGFKVLKRYISNAQEWVVLIWEW